MWRLSKGAAFGMRTILRTGNHRTRVLLTMVIVALATALIVACGGGAEANTGTSTSGNTSGQSTTGSQHFKVGDHVKVGDTYIVTINSVKTNGGTDIDQPKSGDTYLVIDLTVKNASSQEQNLSTLLQLTLKDASGQKYDETVTTFTTPPDGKIEAGDQSRGQVAYEVPKTQHHFTLAFEADITSSGETVWDLSV